MGLNRLTKIQLALEETKGTAVPATTLWRGNGSMKDDSVHEDRDENVGIIMDIDSSYIPALDASLDLSERPASFEQIGYLLEMSMPTATPSANGGTTTAYKWIYTPSITDELTTNKSGTFEIGDNTQAYEMEYGVVKSWKLSGAAKQAVKMSASIFGRQWTKTAFTGSIAVPIEEEIEFEKSKIYLDITTIGSTQLVGTWIAFDMTYTSGLNPDHTADGNLFFFKECFTKPELSGSFTFYHDVVGVVRYDDYVALLGKKLRMDFIGSTLSGSGGTHSTKLLRTDAFMKIDTISLLDQSNGQNTVKVTWSAKYNATASLWAQFTSVNLLAALP